MAEIIQDKQDLKQFAIRIVENNYILRDIDIISTNLVFSSDWVNPRLDTTDNYHFKINYLSNILANEINKMSNRITPTNIKDRAIRSKVVVYYTERMDEQTNRPVDYYFIIDVEKFKAFVFKRSIALETEPGQLYSSLNKVLKLEELSLDEYFENALTFVLDGDSDIQILKEKAILAELKKQKAKLLLFLEDKTPITYLEEKIEIEIPVQKVNQFDIRLISSEKPIIESIVNFVIKGNSGIMHSIKSTIIKERSISYKQYYQLDMLIKFDTKEKLLTAKTILTFIKNLKKQKNK